MNLPPHLAKAVASASSINPEMQTEVIQIIIKMASFNFGATFIKADEGPIVRTYYFAPSPSSLLNQLSSKEEDLALALGAESIIISRELNLISIAVPRKDRRLIRFDECLYGLFSSASIQKFELPILMGQSPNGEFLHMDLFEQPHLMIAGATGSGKSIFTAQIICSLALRHTPSDLHFILADTKQLDLVLFRNLSHVKNVLTDIHALRETLEELIAEVRLRTLAISGLARNIKEYNSLPSVSPYPYKVLVIDEYADIIGSDREYLKSFPTKERPNSIESLIQRLAQISRAAGIHIILATQRPSTKIINGDIKTNFPARIAFRLPTMQDSRVILDENGAEKLLGKGDYLYRINGSDVIKRAHSAFVEMKDVSLILTQHESLRTQFQMY
jgi:S-DNA-T family DNA segregation ATPase FtsK/SpoIIIE